MKHKQIPTSVWPFRASVNVTVGCFIIMLFLKEHVHYCSTIIMLKYFSFILFSVPIPSLLDLEEQNKGLQQKIEILKANNSGTNARYIPTDSLLQSI